MVQIVEILHMEDKDGLSCMVNIMASNVLVMQGARASAAIVLTLFPWNILILAPEGLK